MTESDKWKWKDGEGGVSTVIMSSWQHYMDFVYSEMLDYETYIWRGQRISSWELETTLDRLIKTAKVGKTKQYNFVTNHLEQFKLAARGRRGANPRSIENENEWWALGQHHGLATPLLDWTLSPFVAAYFCFIGTGHRQTKYRAIYALHKPTIEMKAFQIKRDQELSIIKELEDIKSGKKKAGLLTAVSLDANVTPEIEFIRPLSDENHRLVSQGGLFTRTPSGKNLEAWIKEKCAGEEELSLIKILIPNADREQALKTLKQDEYKSFIVIP